MLLTTEMALRRRTHPSVAQPAASPAALQPGTAGAESGEPPDPTELHGKTLSWETKHLTEDAAQPVLGCLPSEHAGRPRFNTHPPPPTPHSNKVHSYNPTPGRQKQAVSPGTSSATWQPLDQPGTSETLSFKNSLYPALGR